MQPMHEPPDNAREIWQLDDLRVDVGSQRVLRGETELPLPKLSFDLLVALIRAAPRVLSNEDLMTRVWPGLVVSPETVVQRVKLLRDALGDEAGEPRYVQALRSRGYRLAVEPARVPQSVPASIPTTPSAGPAPLEAPAWWRSRPLAIGAALIVALLLGLLLWAGAIRAPKATDSATTELAGNAAQVASTVAVLPFKNLSAAPTDAFLALSLPEMVLNRLATVRGLTVIARDSSFLVDKEASDVRDVGRKLGAGYLIDGSVQRQGDGLRVTVRLTDAQAGTQLTSAAFDRPVSQLYQLQDEIASQITLSLESRLRGLAAARPGGPRSDNVDAYLAYLRGRALIGRFTVAETEAAAVQYELATRLDPTFAAAYAALYDARLQAAGLQHLPLSQLQRDLRPLLDKAIALDPNDGSAWYARAMWADQANSAREADYRKAMMLDASNARGLTAFAEFLDYTDASAEGGRVHGSGFDPSNRPVAGRAAGPRSPARAGEAAKVLERVLWIDPLSARVRFRQSMRAARLGNRTGADVAEQQMREILEYDPEYYPALERMAKYRWMYRSKPAEAIAVMERAIRSDPKNPWGPQTVVICYLDVGDEAAARDVAASTVVSRTTAQTVLAQYRGDWRAAGQAALTPEAFEFGFHESWGVPEALRDYALATHQYALPLNLLAERFDIELNGKPRVNLSNMRASVQAAHIQLAAGNAEHSRALLQAVIDWIDSPVAAQWDKVYMRRTRAQALMLLGRRDAALSDLVASFLTDNDYTQWWYALDRDPVWQDVRADVRFVALRRAVNAYVARERAQLEAMRARGDVTRRPEPAPK